MTKSHKAQTVGARSGADLSPGAMAEAQALGIDGHFAIEQGARAWNGLMMNFNGTGGVWRKAAIDDPAVGGWSGDTLTEDLDQRGLKLTRWATIEADEVPA